MWLKSPKRLKRKNSHVVHVFRQVLISRHTKFFESVKGLKS
jgi:hypothetical protein